MKTLLTPKLDLVFKLLFTKNTTILIDLINAVLGLPESQRIRSVTINNPVILPEELAEKFIILDIYAVDELNQQYDIEMQTQQYAYYPERIVYYLSKIYTAQLDSGEQYERLKPVIGIHFLDYEMFPTYTDFHFCFELRDVRYPELRLTDDVALHLLELPKLEKMKPPEGWGNRLVEWLHFFNHAYEEVEASMRTHYQNPAIHEAFKVLETLSADEEVRRLAEIREKALKDKNSALSAAKEEGRKEGELIGKIQILQRVLKCPISSREELLQKSIEELKALLQELEAQLN